MDILAFHTPLFKDGPYKTLHLADKKLICSLKPGAILINTCRGAVINSTALPTCLNEGQKLSVVLDVWEGEPGLNVELLKKADIGAPHIAGYTPEGKARDATQVLEAYSKFIGRKQRVVLDTLLPAPEFDHITPHGLLDQPTLKGLVHLVYDVRHGDAPLHKVTETSGEFDKLHENCLEYREWSSLYVICDDASTTPLLCKLNLNAAHHPAC